MAQVVDLTPSQQEIYNLVGKGMSAEAIANKLGKELSIVNAQLTRMRTKGILPPPTTEKKRTSEKAYTGGPSSNEAIQNALEVAGEAKYEIPKELQAYADKHGEALDVHPMILMGVTIQFVKLCGGRINAHQVIEDVFGGLSLMVNGTEPKTAPGVTKPFPQ